jgi:hypothetical protein
MQSGHINIAEHGVASWTNHFCHTVSMFNRHVKNPIIIFYAQ